MTRGADAAAGKGYYDRFLEGISNALKILIAFDVQKTDEVAMEETDVRMDLVVTEKGINAIQNDSLSMTGGVISRGSPRFAHLLHLCLKTRHDIIIY